MILIFGPPGSGKGTQAGLLQDSGLVQWFSTGEILRANLQSDRESSKMTKGDLVDDSLITKLLRKTIESQAAKDKMVLLDGYPRSLAQIDWLFTEDNPRRVRGVIQLVAPREKLEQRLLLRGQLEGRADDNPQTIRHRFEVYDEQSLPAIENLRSKGIPVVKVNADQPISAVSRDCREALAKLIRNDVDQS